MGGRFYSYYNGFRLFSLGGLGSLASAFAGGSRLERQRSGSGLGTCFTTGAWGFGSSFSGKRMMCLGHLRTCRSPCTCRSPHGLHRPQRGWHRTYRCARTAAGNAGGGTACLPQHFILIGAHDHGLAGAACVDHNNVLWGRCWRRHHSAGARLVHLGHAVRQWMASNFTHLCSRPGRCRQRYRPKAAVQGGSSGAGLMPLYS